MLNSAVVSIFLIALQCARVRHVGGVEIFYVTPDAKHDNNGKAKGKTWSDSVNLTTAFSDAATSTDDEIEIWIKRGRYDAPTEGFFSPVSGNFSVYGGFKGIEDAKEDRRDSNNGKQTVISGLLNSVNDIFTVSTDGNLRIVISDVMFEHAIDNAVYIFNDMHSNVSVAISNAVFESNGDGAIYAKYANVTLIESSFEANSGFSGGALYAGYSDSVHIETCSFIGNTAQYGGALRLNVVSDVTISGCRFELNEGRDGGAIYGSGSTNFVISDTSMVNNTGRFGGAVRLSYTENTIITDSEFIGNNADDYGGGVQAYRARPLSIKQCNFSYNHAGKYGGAMSADTSSVVSIEGSRFANNDAVDGGDSLHAKYYSHISINSSVFIEDTIPSPNDLFSTVDDGSITFGSECYFDFGDAGRTECAL